MFHSWIARFKLLFREKAKAPEIARRGLFNFINSWKERLVVQVSLRCRGRLVPVSERNRLGLIVRRPAVREHDR